MQQKRSSSDSFSASQGYKGKLQVSGVCAAPTALRLRVRQEVL